MDTLQAIESRKSVRQYSDQPVEPEKLETILKAGNKAPNGGRKRVPYLNKRGNVAEVVPKDRSEASERRGDPRDP